MPDFKHHFRLGKMNKDLDERLVPNGEYRDAQNIEISTSEGDDVGTIQNVIGNTRLDGKVYNSNSKSLTSNWSAASFGLTNATCIGTHVNNEIDKIYWFITSNEADCIAEYDEATKVISPVLVDTNDILKFKSTQYITGINMIEGMLCWTDNETEPKKIDVDIFKSGCSSNFTTHTTFHGVAFVESDITVAKKAPVSAPTLTMSTSLRGGNGTGISPVLVSNSSAGLFANDDNTGKDAGTTVSLVFSPAPNFQVNDVLSLTAVYEEAASLTNYEVKVRITSLTNNGVNATCVLQVVPTDLVYQTLTWEALLTEDGKELFEYKFPRFAYRWKYNSGEYSTFSPFSEIAFKPSTFEYLSSDGYNVGMTNNLKNLVINITDAKPADVEEVDVLYKESNNNLVYVVDTLKEGETSYTLESEIISKVVEANQMLRPWDNVPRKAKAQEITANRLIYANYLQQYNIPNINMPDIDMSINSSQISTVKEPELSVKSLRTYQAGVVYVDAYNRQSPVFTDANASKKIGKANAELVNSISLKLNNTPPDWATHFKYYIKETSNEYYNLAMDRYYLAEDGNVWLSFPSSERNKVQEDSYLILKKQHDSDSFVSQKARYKVLDISNDAPDFIKLTKKAVGSTDGACHDSSIPQIGSTVFKFKGPDPLDNPSFAAGFTSDGLIQLAVGSLKTDKYNIVSGGYTGVEDSGNAPKHIYQVTIGEPLKEGETMLNGLADDDAITITLFEEKFERKPEFYGRFFVKINRNDTFDSNIIDTYPDVQAEYGITNSRTIYDNAVNTGRGDGRQEASWYDTRGKKNDISAVNNGHPVLGRGYFDLYWTAAPSKSNPNKRDHDKTNTINSFLKGLNQAGQLFRFKGKTSNTVSEVYKVTGGDIYYNYRSNRKRLSSSKRRRYRVEFEHVTNQTPYEDTFTTNGGNFNGDWIDEIQLLEKVISGDNEVLTSDNPAIWETEPKESAELDLYYETGNTYPVSQHGNTHTLPFKNCYSFGNGVESNRIRDDYNAVQIDKGVKVSTVLAEQYKEERRKSGLIYSGIFNSTSGINRLNQFIQGEKITKDINPHYGGIQLLHARNTDLITFCEDKVLKILANKDALFNADGNSNLTSTNRVLGQAVPFVGDYGISKNPESFACYAFRMYFADKNRGAILRLSRDGLTPISEIGMGDYFRDNLPLATTILGSYDDSKGLYNITLGKVNQTLSFDEKTNGWPSFKSFVPEGGESLNNIYYTIKNGDIWFHTNTALRNNFYGDQYESSVNVLINDEADTIKGFKTVNYSGSRSRKYTKDYDANNNYSNPTETFTKGWYCNSIVTDEQSGDVREFKEKEGRWYNYIKGDPTTIDNLDTQEFSVQGIGRLSAISGDTTLADRVVTVSLTGIANATVANKTFDVEIGTEIHSKNASITMTIVPNEGATVTASDLSVSGGATGNYVDSVAFAQSGANVIATVNFTDGVNMPSSNLTISLAVTGDGALNIYKLNDLNLKNNTDANITVTNSYSGNGNATAEPTNSATGFPGNYATQYTVATKTFDLDSTHQFKSYPSFYIHTEDDDPESEYEITRSFQNSSGNTITQNNPALSDIDKCVFTIKYKFGVKETGGDIIIFNAQSELRKVDEENKITGYNVSGGTTGTRFGETKNVAIYGKVGATFTFTLNIDNAGAKYWDGDSFENSSTTLVIPSTGIYNIPIVFPETSSSKSYVGQIAAISPTALLSPLNGNVLDTNGNVTNPFTLNQFTDVTLTLNAGNSSVVTTTSSNATKSFTALGFPVEGSDAFSTNLIFTGTATNNITKSRDPEVEDFANYNSNGFDWDFEVNEINGVVINNNVSPKTVTVNASAIIEQYGSTDTTVTLDWDQFLTVATGGGGVSGGSRLYTPLITGAGGGLIMGQVRASYNDGTYSGTAAKNVFVGTANNTSLTGGTGVIYGNFYDNGINDITLTITATNSAAIDNLTITKGSLVGVSPSQDLHYTWTGQTKEVIDSASDMTFTVAVALTNEP
tara:strand:- start:2945 stop:8920 length:5976 start_codon:yes stop_codon:yes gene_type:complete